MTRATRRGPWLPEEDQRLLQLVRSQGPNNWVRISGNMMHRSPKQCRERFHQNLKPSLNHEPISPHEGEMIEQMVNDMGKRWAEIARRLGNRSDNAVKNWWNGSMNRRKRSVLHHGSGIKGVGSRLQPISVSRPSKHAVYQPDPHPHHPHSDPQLPRRWTDSDAHAASMAPSLTGYSDPRPSSFPFAGHGFHALEDPHERQLPSLRQIHTSRTAFLQPMPHSHRLSAEPAPNLSSASASDRLTLGTIFSPTDRRFDLPLVSPTTSDISQASSMDHAPSLMSDHNSNSSVSPKTQHSPRPQMLAPIDTNPHHWAERSSYRRGSAPSMVPRTANSFRGCTGDEGYVSAYPASAVSDAQHHLSATEPELDGRASHDAFRSHPYHSASHQTVPNTPLMEPSASDATSPHGARDTRMTFSSLLN